MARKPFKDPPRSRAEAAARFNARTGLLVDADKTLDVLCKPGIDRETTIFALTGAVHTSDCLRELLALAIAEKPNLAPWKPGAKFQDWSFEAERRNSIRTSKTAVRRLEQVYEKLRADLASIVEPFANGGDVHESDMLEIVEGFRATVKEHLHEVYQDASEDIETGEQPAEYLHLAVLRLKELVTPKGKTLTEPDIALLFLGAGVRRVDASIWSHGDALAVAREWVHELAKAGRRYRNWGTTAWWELRAIRKRRRPAR